MTASTHLSNAPLVFVLGVVRVSHYPKFAEKFEDLHEALLEIFPERENIGGILFTGMDQSGRPQFEQRQLWRIFNRVTNSSLLLGNEQFVFEWPQYDSLDYALEGSLSSIFSIFEQLPSLTPTLIGLRYVNVLMDNDPLPLNKSVKQDIVGFRLPSAKFESSQSNSVQVFKSGARLDTRFSCGFKKAGTIVTPQGVAVPKVLRPNKKLEKFQEFEGQYGILDIDGTMELKANQHSPSDILTFFKKLREDMRPVLKNLVDEETHRSWL